MKMKEHCIKLSQADIDALRVLASIRSIERKKFIGTSTLIRECIQQHLLNNGSGQ
jgi:hypothetical protein